MNHIRSTIARLKRHISTGSVLPLLVVLLMSLSALATPPQDDNRRRKTGTGNAPPVTAGNRSLGGGGNTPQTPPRQGIQPRQGTQQRQDNTPATQPATTTGTPRQGVKAQPKSVVDEDLVPDSLVHSRWRIQRTAPELPSDLDTSALDLRLPDNLKQQAEYDDSLNVYYIGTKIGDQYVTTPVMMTPKEYMQWSERRARELFFRMKDAENVAAKGKEKFDFTDMKFDLGPAEKIFGPGGVRIKTQGTAELKLGMTMKDIDNPSLPIRNRKTTAFDFDEKVNLSVNAKVGDKVNMNLNYNTDATFDYDTKNLKLRYEGKEDEIVKLVEAGNISFPSNNSLVHGASQLFGLRTDLQFGKLTLQTVLSQKNTTSKSVSSKGGTQTTPFEIDAVGYEENRHFFLSHYFRDNYDKAMSTLPNLTTGVKINRVEVWVTNKTGTTTDTRNIVAFADLGEGSKIMNPNWSGTGQVPSNQANNLYATLISRIGNDQRGIDDITAQIEGMSELTGGTDYEKLASARLLSSSEYTLNSALGYISLKTTLQTDQVLAVAFEYTYGGQTFQVGEFSTDLTQTDKSIFVKALKNTSNNPQQANWPLMMKNVYYLAQTVEKEKFRMDIKYQSDTTGTYLSYLPEEALKQTTLLKLMGLDRLDNNMKPHPNGQFDYIKGYTIDNGRIFLPSAEPFGDYLRAYLQQQGLGHLADTYCFDELYDSTLTVAKQIAEKDKYLLTGQFKGHSANVISLGAMNVPQGSVVVTAGGVTLQEGSDYSVDYSSGEVTILNQSIIDAGTNVNVSLESNTEYAMQRKTMLGMNWDYQFNKNFSLGGTLLHLHEQPLTSKVSMGEEPLSNTIWGLNLNWKQESQWLTNMLDKLPLLHLTQPSSISLTGEFAQLITSTASGTQDNASYIDDFENTENKLDVSEPHAWILSSVPSMIPNHNDKDSVSSGYDRALLAWYNVDPIFTRRSSSLTPGHIKSDLEQLSDHYVREVYVKELYPNRDQSTYNGATSTLSCLNLAYYPTERGPYNLTTQLNADGSLMNPATKWGGMMRKLETTDFEQANIEYVEFWLLDPFIYTRKDGTANRHSGELYLNLGEVSEDVLRDGKKFYESGMPVDGTENFTTSQWGKIPVQATQTYAFATTSGSRQLQDVGYNGLTDAEERTFPAYRDWLNTVSATVTNDSIKQAWYNDPAGDDYHYFRGSDFDNERRSIMERYKRINNPQGNSPASDESPESYDTSYKTTPDVEDINQDFTLNEYERYYQYRIPISDAELQAYNNGTKSEGSFIVDHRDYNAKLRNGDSATVRWYQYRIPLTAYQKKEGSINDFTSIRFMRMFLTGFTEPIVLRFGSLDLVRGEWRQYKQSLQTASGAETGELVMSAVNIEENTDRQPVAYVLPPGISRATDPSQPQLVENNEQSLCLIARNLSQNESKAVYKTTNLDLRQYKRLQMYAHANRLVPNNTQLEDDQLAVFIRLGSDYKNNYYEYLIPLKLTPEGTYRWNVPSDRPKVWPQENMLDIELKVFTQVKKGRNKARSEGMASYTQPYSEYDPDKPGNRITIVGNPTLGEVKTMIIGVRNLSNALKSGEVWVNELRLKESNNEGGWAASGAMALQLSDFGSLNLTGRYITDGFGGLEEGIMQRSTDTEKSYAITANFELGKFFPDKAKIEAPLYYSYSKETISPKYNPLDSDMRLDDALEVATKEEKDSIESLAVTKNITRNISISNARVGIKSKLHPMPYDPANFSVSYGHQHRYTTGETTIWEKEDEWHGALNYTYSPVYKTIEPFKNLKGKSKWLNFPKAFGLNYLPQNISFGSELRRNYYELSERDLENTENPNLPIQYSEQFLWNRDFSLRWDITKNLHMNFQSATHAEIEEPYNELPLNKDLYPDRYSHWKDSVWQSIKNLGVPLDYQQSFTASYQVPLNKMPIFDWLNADASYSSNYSWQRGTELEDGSSLGNNVQTNRNLNINGAMNLEMLYNHVPFLKLVNDRFKKQSTAKKKTTQKKVQQRPGVQKKGEETDGEDADGKGGKAGKTGKGGKDPKGGKDTAEAEKTALPKNKNTYQREIMLLPDTTLTVQHGKKSKRLYVTAKTPEGKNYKIKFKAIDDNKILIKSKGDSIKLKLSVVPKKPLDENWWYDPAQYAARLLMMVRSVNASYRNQYSLQLPGFIPNVGDAFGQRTGSVMAPGLDFAFGFVDDNFVDKALERDWLNCTENVATPSTSSKTEDLQLKATVEPVRDLKIDLSATRTVNKSKSVQFMYAGTPTTFSGSFTMTTLSLGSALEGMGDAANGYYSKTFEKFRASIPQFQQRVQAQYAQATPPADAASPATGTLIREIDEYSADVLVPAFLASYTTGAGSSLDIFPALTRLLPNWTVKYAGLAKLPWIRDRFKSVNINHGYKSIYAVGSYASYSSWVEYMDGLGFVRGTDGSYSPSSMYNVSTVSINEAFSPLLGLDMTFNNNLTVKAEYKTTRVLNLSMTSVQVNESRSNDWVIGLGYKISDFKLFGGTTSRKIKKAQRGKGRGSNDEQDNKKSSTSGKSGGVNHDLNLRCDVSFRDQAAITRDIATGVSSASSGNSALKISFSADYTLSRFLTFSAYYDRQTNTPLLSASSYPTTTRDFGMALKFSLTR